MKYIIAAIALILAGSYGIHTVTSPTEEMIAVGGEGTIRQLEQWKNDGTYITQNRANTNIKLTGYGSSGDCLVTDSNGVVSTSTCGGGGSSKWTDAGTVIYPASGESIAVSSITATGTDTSTIANLNGATFVDGIRYPQTNAGIAAAIARGGDVVLPSMNVTITSAISIPSNTNIYCQASTTVLTLGNSANVNIFISSGTSNISIDGCILDGNKANNSTSSGIAISGVSDFTLKNSVVRDFPSTNFICSSGCSNVHIEKSNLKNTTEAALAPNVSFFSSNNIWIKDSYFGKTNYPALNFQPASGGNRSVRITGNNIEDVGQVSTTTLSYGIYMNGGTEFYVDKNYVKNIALSGIYSLTTGSSTYSHNTVINTLWGIDNDGGATIGSDNNSIIGNNISSSTNAAIWVGDSHGVTVIGNRGLNNCNPTGYASQIVLGGTYSSSTYANTFTGNSFTDTLSRCTYGMYVDDVAYQNKITGNTFIGHSSGYVVRRNALYSGTTLRNEYEGNYGDVQWRYADSFSGTGKGGMFLGDLAAGHSDIYNPVGANAVYGADFSNVNDARVRIVTESQTAFGSNYSSLSGLGGIRLGGSPRFTPEYSYLVGGYDLKINPVSGNVVIGSTIANARLSIYASSSADIQPLLSLNTPTPAGLATTTVAVFDAYGRLGLGTSTPLARLDVYGIAGANPAFRVSSSTNASMFSVLANGNVGINTATPAQKLSVTGGELALTGLTSQLTNADGLMMYGGTNGGKIYARGNVSGGDDNLVLVWGDVLNLQSNYGSTPVMTMLKNGNVGIGTTTPSSKLTVFGKVGTDGPVPTLSGCGTSPSITSGSTDTAGEITEGTIATGCTLTFASAYTAAPFCVVTAQSGLSFSYTVSTSAITMVNIGALSGTKINYHCISND